MTTGPRWVCVVCNAYNLRHRNEAILDTVRAMQLPFDDLPEFPPRHRIGITDRGLILRPRRDGPLAWSGARWSSDPARQPRAAGLPAQQWGDVDRVVGLQRHAPYQARAAIDL